MRLFSRYMAKRFIKPFLYGLGLFALLLFTGTVFDRMSALVRSPAPIWVIMQYLWLEVPYWAVRVIPVATLLATLVAVTGFVQSGEALAAQASGFALREFMRPLMWCSLGVALVCFAAQETILPACYRRSRQLWYERINPAWEWEKYLDVAVIAKPGLFIQTSVLVPKEGRMERAILEEVGPNGVERQWDAKIATWDRAAGRWVFHEGVERRFRGTKIREEAFASRETPLDVPPKLLVPRTRTPDEMSLREIRSYGPRARHLGASPREYEMAAHAKVAYPFSNVVVCALGIPVALRLRRAAKALIFGLALGVSFLYLWVMEVGRALGAGGTIHPLAAAWIPNLAFGVLAAWLFRRAET